MNSASAKWFSSDVSGDILVVRGGEEHGILVKAPPPDAGNSLCLGIWQHGWTPFLSRLTSTRRTSSSHGRPSGLWPEASMLSPLCIPNNLCAWRKSDLASFNTGRRPRWCRSRPPHLYRSLERPPSFFALPYAGKQCHMTRYFCRARNRSPRYDEPGGRGGWSETNCS